jgi:hypothetical protein
MSLEQKLQAMEALWEDLSQERDCILVTVVEPGSFKRDGA